LNRAILGLIFDFDGVLANTEDLHFGAFARIFAGRGWTFDRNEYYETYIGFDDHDLLLNYARNRSLELSTAELASLAEEKRLAFAMELKTRDVLFEGAREAIEALRPHYALAVASGALHEEIVTVLTTGHLIDAFPVIVGADDVARSKPAPDTYLAAAKRLGIDPANCVGVEDSRWGLASARDAGMRTIAVTTTATADQLRADLILGGIRDVTPERVASLGGILN
jgi:HAD superfamily hydrolase (TIGR01509 family)